MRATLHWTSLALAGIWLLVRLAEVGVWAYVRAKSRMTVSDSDVVYS